MSQQNKWTISLTACALMGGIVYVAWVYYQLQLAIRIHHPTPDFFWGLLTLFGYFDLLLWIGVWKAPAQRRTPIRKLAVFYAVMIVGLAVFSVAVSSLLHSSV